MTPGERPAGDGRGPRGVRAEPAAWVLMAKEPRAGAVKTRLCPPLSPEEAADLYRAFLSDLAGRLRRDPPEAAVYVAVHPADAVAPVARLFEGTGARAFAQEGPGLPERMEAAFARAFAAGHARVALTNTDSPHLGWRAHVRPALEALEDRSTGIALGPDLTGGYYLVALKRPVAGLFHAGEGTARSLELTCARAAAAGLSIDLLPATPDVDTYADLFALAALVAGGTVAPRELPATLPRVQELVRRHGPGPLPRG